MEAVLGTWRITSEKPKVPTWVLMGADGVLGYKIVAWDSKAQECQGTLFCESQEIIHSGLQMNKGEGLPIFIQECQSSKRLT